MMLLELLILRAVGDDVHLILSIAMVRPPWMDLLPFFFFLVLAGLTFFTLSVTMYVAIPCEPASKIEYTTPYDHATVDGCSSPHRLYRLAMISALLIVI